MAKEKKTMRITLTEDFLVPTDTGNIIFEPGDEIEIEYDDEDLGSDGVFVDDEIEEEPPVEEPAATDPEVDPIVPDPTNDPLSFAGNDTTDVYDDIQPPEEELPPVEDPFLSEPKDEVYIEDPFFS